jgi:hypothetical protein
MLCGFGGARGAPRLFTITAWRNDDAGAEVSEAMSAAAVHRRPRQKDQDDQRVEHKGKEPSSLHSPDCGLTTGANFALGIGEE